MFVHTLLPKLQTKNSNRLEYAFLHPLSKIQQANFWCHTVWLFFVVSVHCYYYHFYIRLAFSLWETKKSLIKKTTPRSKCIILSGLKTNKILMSAFVVFSLNFKLILSIQKRKIYFLINHFNVSSKK